MELYKNILKTKAYRWNIDYFCDNECGYKPEGAQSKVLNHLMYRENDKVVISAAAGVGKTLGMAMYSTWCATVLSDYLKQPLTINVLGGSQKQSRILYRYVKDFIDYSNWIANKVDGEPLRSKTNWNNDSRISALAAGPKSVRGEHSDILIIDEAVEVDKQLINAGLSRVKTDVFPKKILCSTPHQFDSYFVDIWNNSDEYGYNSFHWSAKDVPWKTTEEIEEAEKFYDSATYEIEFEGKPVPIKGTVFNQEDVGHAIVDDKFESDEEKFVTMGIDWGIDHPTAVCVLQKEGNYLQVLDIRAWREKKFSWILSQIETLYDRYNVDVVYADNSHKGENQRLIQKGVTLSQIAFTQQRKQAMKTETRLKFEGGKILIPANYKELIQELRKYTSKTKVHDDRVDALMLSVYAHKKSGSRQTTSSSDRKWYSTKRRR